MPDFATCPTVYMAVIKFCGYYYHGLFTAVIVSVSEHYQYESTMVCSLLSGVDLYWWCSVWVNTTNTSLSTFAIFSLLPGALHAPVTYSASYFPLMHSYMT